MAGQDLSVTANSTLTTTFSGGAACVRVGVTCSCGRESNSTQQSRCSCGPVHRVCTEYSMYSMYIPNVATRGSTLHDPTVAQAQGSQSHRCDDLPLRGIPPKQQQVAKMAKKPSTRRIRCLPFMVKSGGKGEPWAVRRTSSVLRNIDRRRRCG